MPDVGFTMIHRDGVRALPPETVLKAAKLNLTLLKEIEKSVMNRKRAKILWQINIYTLIDRTVLEFTAANINDRLTLQAVTKAAQQQRESGLEKA